MRKTLLYSLYAIAAIFACIAVYATVRTGKPDPLILLFFLSPILLNALRNPQAPTDQHPVERKTEMSNADAAESLSTDLSKLFKTLAKICLGLLLLFLFMAPFWVLAGFAMGYALVGALLSYGLAKAFE